MLFPVWGRHCHCSWISPVAAPPSALLPGFWSSSMPGLHLQLPPLIEYTRCCGRRYTQHSTYSPSIIPGHYHPFPPTGRLRLREEEGCAQGPQRKKGRAGFEPRSDKKLVLSLLHWLLAQACLELEPQSPRPSPHSCLAPLWLQCACRPKATKDFLTSHPVPSRPHRSAAPVWQGPLRLAPGGWEGRVGPRRRPLWASPLDRRLPALRSQEPGFSLCIRTHRGTFPYAHNQNRFLAPIPQIWTSLPCTLTDPMAFFFLIRKNVHHSSRRGSETNGSS